MKKRLKQVLDDYFTHLCGMQTSGTSKSYVSYTRSAINQILKPYFESNTGSNPFESFSQSKSRSVQRSLIIAISESLLEKEIHGRALGKPEKTIRNWRSGLRAFLAFLESEEYYFDCIISKSTLEDLLKKQKGSVAYSQSDMREIFLSRLITQDRAYKHMIYPARVMNQIFNNSDKRDVYHKIMNDALATTKFLIDDKGKFIPLEDIDHLSIDYGNGGKVSICASDKYYDLYTENSTSCYEKITVTDFGDLSLDHDTPLQNILDKPSEQKKYPKLYDLSCMYASFVKGSDEKKDFLNNKDIRNFKKHSPKFYDKKESELLVPALVDKLFSDFFKLYQNISFTIMLTKYNSSKGKGKNTNKEEKK